MVTRFRPTPSGDLHCGHVWIALHNWQVAHQTGDPFVLIGDDLTYNLQYLATANYSFAEGMARIEEDLRWLGLAPDEVVWSSMNAEAHGEAAARLGMRPISRNHLEHVTMGLHCIASCTPMATPTAVDSYSPWLVLCRAVDDHEAGVQAFYRGDDLIGERQLYDYLVRQLRYVPPAQEYLPVVYRVGEERSRKESKTFGAVPVRELRAAGYQPEHIIQTLQWCAEVSQRERRAGVMIPPGYLTTEAVQWHPYSVHKTRYAEPPTPPGYASDAVAKRHRKMMRARMGID
jgi:glutamyl/glutaminyl-tRNA synthetase